MKFPKQSWLFTIIIVVFFFSPLISQEPSSKDNVLNEQLLKETFSAYKSSTTTKRLFLDLRNEKLGTKLNPLTYLAAALLYVYQNVISEQISANCNYQISCSEYTKRCIERYGLIKGTLLGLHQLSCCIPNIQDQHCDYVISDQNKIINEVE